MVDLLYIALISTISLKENMIFVKHFLRRHLSMVSPIIARTDFQRISSELQNEFCTPSSGSPYSPSQLSQDGVGSTELRGTGGRSVEPKVRWLI